MTTNPKVAFYRERFNLQFAVPMEGLDNGKVAVDLADPLAGPDGLNAIRDAIADLQSDLDQLDQVIRVLEWLAADPPRLES
jgi:hypothetical protein